MSCHLTLLDVFTLTKLADTICNTSDTTTLERIYFFSSRLDWILQAQDGPVAGFCEEGNEPSRSIKGGEFIEQTSDCQILKEGCAPRSQILQIVVFSVVALCRVQP
jgi:hypothetical protein